WCGASAEGRILLDVACRREPTGESSMPKRIIRPAPAPVNAASSQAVVSNGLVFVSGQGPFDPKTGEVVGGSIGEQTAQALRNVEAILTAGGTALAQEVRAAFLLDAE